MGKLCLILLQIVLALTAVLTKSIQSGSETELEYLGTFRRVTGNGDTQNYDENNYYVSANSVSITQPNVSFRQFKILFDSFPYQGNMVSGRCRL